MDEADAKIAEGCATMTYLVPQAREPESLKGITPENKDQWIKSFDLAEEISIAERAEALTAKALETASDNPELGRIAQAAKATTALVRFFESYHRSLVDFNLARNTPDAEVRKPLVEESRENLKRAIAYAFDYKNVLLPIVTGDESNQGYLKSHVKLYYVPTVLCIVREAAYLFDQETGGGERVLDYFDARAKMNDSKPPA